MAANRFAVLSDEVNQVKTTDEDETKPADKFDTTTLTAALKGAR